MWAAAEEHLARMLVYVRQRAAHLLADVESAPDRGTDFHTLVPALEVRIVIEVLSLPLVGAELREDRHVGYRVLVFDDKRSLGEPPVYHPVEPGGFVGVAFDGIGDLLGSVLAKVVDLAQHRAHVAYLEHQSLQYRVPLAG